MYASQKFHQVNEFLHNVLKRKIQEVENIKSAGDLKRVKQEKN